MRFQVLYLILLSPIVAELVSGSTPFFTFLNPVVLMVYVGFYGMGCLIIREVAARKSLCYSSVLLLGAAFGVLEEGILLRSWFDPHWMGAQITSQALRIYGVSVLQPFANVVYHAVVSIATPIVLMNALHSREPWLSRRSLFLAGVLCAGSAVLLHRFNDYQVAGWQYLMGILLFGIFVASGIRGVSIPPGIKKRSPQVLWAMGSVFVVLLFFIFYTLSAAGVSWAVILVCAFSLYVGYAVLYAGTRFEPAHFFASASGILTGLVFIVVVMARRDPSKILNVVAALLLVMYLVVLYRRHFKV
ncbi:MAG: hypothetical protein HXS52_00055 [Theionarchaea archaeon]|nr:hypothetical protein [Theionarchaea archaeon]MBU7036294.1 hypothetical protein [Theionarchaea archaeon]